jgi:hypothetical protein
MRMKTIPSSSFAALLDEFAQAFAKVARHGARMLARMSWPALLGCCVLMALAITIVPLALLLFIVFMAIKLIVGAIVVHTRIRSK